MKIKTIDFTPTWRQSFDIYIDSLQKGNAKQKQIAKDELYRLADYLDTLNKKQHD